MAYDPEQNDICKDRSRNHRNSRAAHSANEYAHLSRRMQVLAVIVEAGIEGATNHEIAAKLRRLPHHISPRLSELKALELIFETDQSRRRRGFNPAAVCVATRFRRQWQREQKRKQKDSGGMAAK